MTQEVPSVHAAEPPASELRRPESPLPGITAGERARELEQLQDKARQFAQDWMTRQQGSAADFVHAMEREFGTTVRMLLLEIVKQISEQPGLTKAMRQYAEVTLSKEELKLALGSKPKLKQEELSSLDELFARSKIFRSSSKYAEAISFISRFRTYSPYNNMLVYLQNPLATFWATAMHWRREFRRRVKDDARPMLILAPMTPVVLVYDVADTEGDPLPDWFKDPFDTQGFFNSGVLSLTTQNCSRDRIQIAPKKLGFLHAGSAIQSDRGTDAKIRIELNADLDDGGRYSTLCHELAHIHLGHLGSDQDRWWPSRLNLTKNQREIEAETVAYIVCRRAGLTTKSAEYLAGYIGSPDDLTRISIDLIIKVAGLIEHMGKEELPPRRKPAKTTR